NLLILIMGGQSGVAPIVADGVTAEEMSDPLPQALILTAIVITFGVSSFLMALIYRSWRLSKDDDVDDDADDVALREFSEGMMADEASNTSSDTEFGIRAEAAVSAARDLERMDEAEAHASGDASIGGAAADDPVTPTSPSPSAASKADAGKPTAGKPTTSRKDTR
ncbi:MAG: sodium:proton antiporter, partial [Glaciihabitans sp.]|nr:sodium:proton antiporter [Glaciihabitans sp.]